ncbi:MAG: hypothetical protein WC179_06955 [Candidatus Cloacimonadaceae bacterium]
MRRQTSAFQPVSEVSRQLDDTAYDNVKIVKDNIDSVNTVAEALDAGSFDVVATNVDDVVIVADNIDSVSTVATDIANINTIATNISDINTISTNMDDINTLVDTFETGDYTTIVTNIGDIVTVADNIASVNTTATSIANVNTVSTNIINVDTTATNITKVVDVADDLVKINSVSDDLVNIDLVALDLDNIDLVAGSISGVNTVSTNIDDVNTVSTNMVDINAIADNIDEILLADENAETATTKAEEAAESATDSQLKAWIAEANQKTADSYATEAEDTFVKVYTSNGDGTFTATDTTEYSALHYAAKGSDFATTSQEGAQVILDNKTNLDLVAEDLGNIDKVADDLPSIDIASENIDSIKTVAANIDDIVLSMAAYKLGTPGEIGFGVATARPEQYNAAGLVPYEGHDIVTSPNYAKYLHVASGSTLYYIPKHYYKQTINEVLFSDVPLVGYVLDRSFINAGIEIAGVFVFAYGGSNNAGKLSARQGYDPVSTNSAHNPISALSTAPANNYGGVYKAVKSCDAKAFATPIWERTMLARLARAHGKAATSQTACAFMDVNPKQPKGNNNNALKDYNDAGVTFTSSGYSNCALTGSGTPFAKTTHNGQECGIADLNGNMWEVCSGLTYKARTGATGTSGTNAVSLTAHGYIVGDKMAFGATPSTGATYNTALYTVATVIDANNFTLSTNLERNILATDGIYTGKTFYILKESVDITAIIDDSTTAGTGAYDINLYEQIDLSATVFDNSGWTYLGNAANQVFEFNTDRNSAAYKRASIGIPLVAGISAGGTTDFGNDAIYRYLRHDLAVLAGGDWGDTSNAGVGAVTLLYSRTNSYGSVGVRASFLG